MTVFVSIAAYRDPELLSTLRDCLATAARPEDLRFGLCWQHDEIETLGRFAADPRFRVVDVDWRESLGACWARAQVMERYDGEDYYLQLDSHHRFAPRWDERLIRHLRRAASDKPVLSTYLPSYEPGRPPVEYEAVATLEFDRFAPGGVPLLRGARLGPEVPLDRPVPAKFISAHFIWARGSFVTEVPYDPELYFHGEEISLSIRAWTHGWDIFCPPENLLWHYYLRPAGTRHWDDHPVWIERDRASKRRVRRLLAGRQAGKFGLGPVRTAAEFERHVGLSFAAQSPIRPAAAPPVARPDARRCS